MLTVAFVLTTWLISTVKFAEGAPYGNLQGYEEEDKRSLSRFDQRDLFEKDADVLRLLRRLLDDSSLSERKRMYENNDAAFNEQKPSYQKDNANKDLDEYVRSMFRARNAQNSHHGQTGYGQDSDEDMDMPGYGHGSKNDMSMSGHGQRSNNDMGMSGYGQDSNNDMGMSGHGQDSNNDMGISGMGYDSGNDKYYDAKRGSYQGGSNSGSYKPANYQSNPSEPSAPHHEAGKLQVDKRRY